ncbi:MAG: hypothetical protein ACRDSF_08365, partial [Pseudonocardiaceae bacterium]
PASLCCTSSAHAGLGTWATAHAWVRAATRCEISAADNAGLYIDAPAISFVLHAAGADEIPRYAAALTTLDAHVANLAHRRVDAALARIDPARWWHSPNTTYSTT